MDTKRTTGILAGEAAAIRAAALRHAASIAHGKQAAYTRYGQPAKASAAAAIASRIAASIGGGV
jgi:hypothetical protein